MISPSASQTVARLTLYLALFAAARTVAQTNICFVHLTIFLALEFHTSVHRSTRIYSFKAHFGKGQRKKSRCSRSIHNGLGRPRMNSCGCSLRISTAVGLRSRLSSEW